MTQQHSCVILSKYSKKTAYSIKSYNETGRLESMQNRKGKIPDTGKSIEIGLGLKRKSSDMERYQISRTKVV